MSAPFVFPFAREKSPRQTRGLPRIAPPPFSGERFVRSLRFGFLSLSDANFRRYFYFFALRNCLRIATRIYRLNDKVNATAKKIYNSETVMQLSCN
jgi:hypothetical protein